VLASLVLLQAGLLLLDTLHIQICLPSLFVWFTACSAAGLLISRRLTGARSLLPGHPAMSAWRTALPPVPVLAVAGLGLGSVLLRTLAQPLAGWDNEFRWDHLARLMLDHGSLQFYPPRSAADFFLYPWPDGIPPLVSGANLWIYLSTGTASGILIAGRVLLELLLVAALTIRISRRLWGAEGAGWPLLALGGCGLFLFAVSLGQETGLTAFCVLLLCELLLEHRDTRCLATAAWAGAAAGTAALVRDYNLALIPATALLLVARGARARPVACALAAAAAVAGPWYLRNWLLTGNPLYPHSLAGLFPSAPFYEETMRAVREYLAPGVAATSRWLPALLVGVGPLALAGAFVWYRAPRRAWPVAALAAVMVWLWWITMPSTGGQMRYSLRVLGGAAPLLCILLGALPWPRARIARALLCGAALLLTADAARRSWIFLHAPLAPPLPWNWDEWTKTLPNHVSAAKEDLWISLAAEAAGEAILTDHPAPVALGARLGLPISSIFSPVASPMTEATTGTDFSTIMRDLIDRRIRYVVLHDNHWTTTERIRTHPGFRPFATNPPTLQFANLRVYDLRLLREEFQRLGIYSPAP
jgi:hypothetical protein